MRLIKLVILAAIGVALLVMALANRGMVTLTLLPAFVADFIGWNQSAEVPLFAVVLGGVGVGLLIGFLWEWIREHKHRRAVKVEQRKVSQLESKMGQMRAKSNEGKDEVLALLDNAEGAR